MTVLLILMSPWCPELGDWLVGCIHHVLPVSPCEMLVRAVCF